MQILIDLQGAQNGSRHRGIGRYSLALAKAIAQNAGQHWVCILLNGRFRDSVEEIISSFEGILAPDRFLIFNVPGPVSALRLANTWRRQTAEILREYVINSFAPDVVLVTSMIEGADDDTITSIGSLPVTVPVTAVIYDLIPMLDPQGNIAAEHWRKWYESKIAALLRGDMLFGISQFTVDEAITRLKISPKSIRNVSSAADKIFSPLSSSSCDVSAVIGRFGISRKFLMHSGAFELRKNFQGLIRAYAELPITVRKQYQLVMVSRLDKFAHSEISALVTSLGLAADDVLFTGFVDDQDLVALYFACHLFVYPSFLEGFGLPALEAMSCGTPTIGSDRTSVPEVIGCRDALFDPSSVQAMSDLMCRALTDEHFYDSLRIHAKEQAAKFSWDDTAIRVIAGLQEVVEKVERPSSREVDNTGSLRMSMLEAVARVTRNMEPDDFEILELAKNIEANRVAVERLKVAAKFVSV
jgi:glycosyltransferase involved in cell wall biosynthesis